MKRKETISITIPDIEECIIKKLNEKYQLDKQKDIVEIRLASNIQFILFEVIRKIDKKEIDKKENITEQTIIINRPVDDFEKKLIESGWGKIEMIKKRKKET